MKKRIVKTVLSLVLAGTLAFGSAGASWTGMETVEAAKVVQQTALGQVTGIKFDAKKQEITWNKVSHATEYKVTVTSAAGAVATDTVGSPSISWWQIDSGYDDNGNYYDFGEGTYTVSIIAKDTTCYYEVGEGVEYDAWDWDNVAKKDRYYKHPVGPAGTAVIQVSADKKAVTNAITALPGVVKKEATETGIVFKLSGNVTLNQGETICWQYSNNAKFSNSGKDNFSFETNGYYDEGYDEKDTYTVYFSNYNPGDTIYVRARVYNGYYQKPGQEYTYDKDKYGQYTSTATYTVPKAKIGSVSTSVEAASITLSAQLRSGSVTGYQFAKKVKSKWVTLGTQTSPAYVDQGLAKNTKYQYRVRGYHYNKLTKKTTWTDWYLAEATTWGANLDVKADAASATSVKLTWKPVPDAEGYEIYRYDTESYSKNSEKGTEIEYFRTKALVKTIKKAKTKTYTDKKLSKSGNYTYVVRAYKTVNKVKIYLDDEATVSLKAGSLNEVSSYYAASGKYTVTWQKMTGIQGYYVEKLDEGTGKYVQVKKLGAKATSYTFAKVDVGSDCVEYRIRPYDKTTVYEGEEYTVRPSIAAVKNVKAVKTANGIQVTWSAVAGADYYKVYRTTNSNLRYNKTTKTHAVNGYPIEEAAINTANCKPQLEYGYGYQSVGTYATEEIRGTSVLDATLTYQTKSRDENGEYIKVGTSPEGDIYQTEEAVWHEGPEPGVTYYYYVVAYAEAPNGALNYGTISSVGCTKPASATYTNAIAKKVSKITSASSKKKGQVTISFKKVSGVDGYAIYRSAKKNGTYAMVGTSTKNNFTDAGVQSGKTYYYKVASFKKSEAKANIYSAKTTAKKVKVK